MRAIFMIGLCNGVSILIPTWNNLSYLSKCIEFLRKYSTFEHEIILHVNDGSDGTLEYATTNNILHTHSADNIGICKAVNMCAKLATKPYVMYFNDDMLALPDWDNELFIFARDNNIPDDAWLSPTLIEPQGKNPCFLANRNQFNYGRQIKEFDEDRLYENLSQLRTLKPDVSGTTWAPHLIHLDMWQKIGGLSEEYSATNDFGSDPDVAKKMWDSGCRIFVGVGRSLVYHFGSIANKKRPRINGRRLFKSIHGMSIEHFITNILHRGTEWKSSI